jgi:hypothetical protein
VDQQTIRGDNYSNLDKSLMDQTTNMCPILMDAIASTVVNNQLQTRALHELTATRYYLETLLPSQFPLWTSETTEAVCRLILKQVKDIFYTYALIQHQ